MRARFWGTRGSLPTPDPEMTRMGGNTSCVELRGRDGTVLVLDAGTGIRRLGRKLSGQVERVDILLTHLHMDHIQGLGFFAPLFEPGVEAHIWGPASSTQSLSDRLVRYLSPPLFPVHLREVPSDLHIHDVTGEQIEIGELQIDVAFVCHPNPTVGYRISDGQSVLTYIPDHEPYLGNGSERPRGWVSGLGLADGADVLIHDAQYSAEEYPEHVGWGHSSVPQAVDFAREAGVRMLVPFHHDPAHTDDDVDRLIEVATTEGLGFSVVPAREEESLVIERAGVRIVPPGTMDGHMSGII